VARVSADAQQPIEYERSGSLHVARNDAAAMELAIAARRFAHAGVAHELMPPQEAHRLEPALSPRMISALLLPDHGYVRASELTSALLAAAIRRGAEMVVASVEEICPGGSACIVRSSAGPLESDAIVIAAGSWSGRVPPLTPPVRPVRGQLLHLHFKKRQFSRVVWGSIGVWAPGGPGSWLVGPPFKRWASKRPGPVSVSHDCPNQVRNS